MSTEILERLEALERKVDAMTLDPERLARFDAMVDALGTFAQRLPTIADAAGTTATWAWTQAEDRGIDPIATGRRTTELALAAADPEFLDLAERMLAKRAALTAAVEALESVDDADLSEVATRGAALTGKLAALLRTEELGALLDASADPKALSTAQAATTALVDTRSQPVESVGLFGAIRRMGDPDVQRAVGFSLSLAKRFGQLLGRA